MDAGEVALRCHELGVHMLPGGDHGLRAVIHREISSDDADRALEVIASALREARSGRRG